MLLILLTQLLMAQTPLFNADCGELEDAQNGVPPVAAPYTGVQIRYDNGHFKLIVGDAVGGNRRMMPLVWDSSYQQHVARFSNGEAWLVSGKSPHTLTVHFADKISRCASIVVARDPFDGAEYDPEVLWRATQEIAGGCGSSIGNPEP